MLRWWWWWVLALDRFEVGRRDCVSVFGFFFLIVFLGYVRATTPSRGGGGLTFDRFVVGRRDCESVIGFFCFFFPWSCKVLTLDQSIACMKPKV